MSNQTVNEVSPPKCERCDAPLTTDEDLNRRIDWAIDMCTPCMEIEEDDSCWCMYGWFIEGDPRQFQPDEENSDTELAAWRSACESWAHGEYVNPATEEHGPWVEAGTGRVSLGERPSTTAIGHCSAPRAYGMGALYCDKHKQPLDAWKSWPTRHSDLVKDPAS